MGNATAADFIDVSDSWEEAQEAADESNAWEDDPYTDEEKEQMDYD